MSSQTTPQITFIKQIGVGAFATVYKVQMNGNNYALKQIDLEQSPEELLHCQKEILTMSQLNSPYIIRYIQSYTSGQNLNVLMELGECSLADVLRISPLNERQAAVVCGKVLMGLEYLHEHGVLHRDVKSQNTILSHGRVQLCDFGVSARLTNTINKSFSMVGTAHYAAPEQITGQGASYAADVWSVGILVIQMITGKIPYDTEGCVGIIQMIRQKTFRPDKDFVACDKYSKSARDFVESCLQHDPSKRPTASQLLKTKFIQSGLKTEQTCGLDDVIQRTVENLAIQQPNTAEQERRLSEQTEPGWDFSNTDEPRHSQGDQSVAKLLEAAAGAGLQFTTTPTKEQAKTMLMALQEVPLSRADTGPSTVASPAFQRARKIELQLDEEQLEIIKAIEQNM